MPDEKTDESDTEGEKDDSSDTLYERTNKATERQEAANKKTEDLLKRQEEHYEKQKLGGLSTGAQEPPKEAVVSDEEYADKFMKGEVNPLSEDGISIDP